MILVDASALAGILLEEEDAPELLARLGSDRERRTIPLAIWEAALALSRFSGDPPAESHRELETFLARLGVSVEALPPSVTSIAIEAHERFGKGRHPARLNFGDCFAYACATLWGAKLLYKGEDFALTDIPAA